MKNKINIIVICTAILLVAAIGVIAVDVSSGDYRIRFSIGSIAVNGTSSLHSLRLFSDAFSANITTTTFAGRLSILGPNFEPLEPIINLPRNNSATTNTTIEFSWSNTTDPNQEIDFDKISYVFELYNDSALTQIYFINESIEESQNTTGLNFTVPEEITLYWRIMATDGQLNSTYTAARTVIFDRTNPTSFDLLSPSNGTTTKDNTPSLAWEATNETNLDNYTIEFSTSEAYTTANYTQHSTVSSLSNWTARLEPETYFWKVIAYDLAGNSNESNQQFTLAVSAITQTTTETVTSGAATTSAGGTIKVPFNLDIIAPPSVTIYSQDSVIVPLIVTNPANQITLNGIDLNVTSESEDVSPVLGATFIPKLRPKEQRQIPLTIVTHTLPGTYGITITAEVFDPQFTDSVKIFANLIESDEETTKTNSEKQIIFAEELFRGNPGCVELQEYITQAKQEFENKRFDKSLNLANNAVQSCKDLIAFSEEPKTETFEKYVSRLKLDQTTLILLGEGVAFLLTMIIVIKLIRKRK